MRWFSGLVGVLVSMRIRVVMTIVIGLHTFVCANR